jgi:acetoin utilization protein AcuC
MMGWHRDEQPQVGVYAGDALARYGFGPGHPFGGDRFDAFMDAFHGSGLENRTRILPPVSATADQVLRFHHPDYLRLVQERSRTGTGLLDTGDTPAAAGIYEAALYVVGSVLDGVERILSGELTRAFVPVAGLHHARPDSAAGFCVFNDCAIAIETLLRLHELSRVAYVDIDAHHGDGVFYAYAEDPKVIIVDFHEDGRWLYPGTGGATEVGVGPARGTKRNIPLPPGADDALFFQHWRKAADLIQKSAPQFILLQCGGDGLAGDPLTHLQLTHRVHREVSAALCRIADACCRGRLLALGGGGYDRAHTARAWVEVVRSLSAIPDPCISGSGDA